MSFLKTTRSEKASPSDEASPSDKVSPSDEASPSDEVSPRHEVSPRDEVSHIQQIETLNTRLDHAREIFAADRVSTCLNQKDHYVVYAPQEHGVYIVNIVNPEDCCPEEQRRYDLLKGYYCEHRLAVELFKEAQNAKGQPTGNVKKIEATTIGFSSSP